MFKIFRVLYPNEDINTYKHWIEVWIFQREATHDIVIIDQSAICIQLVQLIPVYINYYSDKCILHNIYTIAGSPNLGIMGINLNTGNFKIFGTMKCLLFHGEKGYCATTNRWARQLT